MGENSKIEQMEIQAIELLFDLPTHIPTPALIFSFGLLYTTLRIKQRQLIYLWKILNRDNQHWTQKALFEIMEKYLGWGRGIKDTLTKHNLPIDQNEIKAHRKNEWKNKVKGAIEKKNIER